MKIDINKVILLFLVISMLLPSSISIFGVSISTIIYAIIGAIFIYLFASRRNDVVSGLRNRFIFHVFIFIMAIAISLIINIQTVEFNDVYEIIKYMVLAIISIIIMKICKEEKYAIFLLKTINIFMIIICIFGIIQYFNPFSINELYVKYYAPTQYRTLVNNYPNPRIVGVKSNPSVYGFLVSLGVYFNLIYYKYAKHKSLCWISISLCIINLILTLTRTIQIAFICSIIVFILINVLLKKGWKKALFATFLSVAMIIILFSLLPEELTWRLFEVTDISSANSWVERTEKWENYKSIIDKNLFLGIGPVKNYTNEIVYVDNEFIQNLLQYGIVGLSAYIIMLFIPLYIYIKNTTHKNIIKYYVPVLLMILINNMSSTSLILFDTAVGAYIMFGVILIKEREFNE